MIYPLAVFGERYGDRKLHLELYRSDSFNDDNQLSGLSIDFQVGKYTNVSYLCRAIVHEIWNCSNKIIVLKANGAPAIMWCLQGVAMSQRRLFNAIQWKVFIVPTMVEKFDNNGVKTTTICIRCYNAKFTCFWYRLFVMVI